MSYRLIKVHWKIGNDSNSEIEDKYSYHLSNEDFAIFAKAIIMEGLSHHPLLKYRTEGVSEVHHAPGNLFDEVKRAKLKNQYGIWVKSEEMALKS